MNLKVKFFFLSFIFLTFNWFAQKNESARLFSEVDVSVNVGYSTPIGRISATELKQPDDPSNYYKYQGGGARGGFSAQISNRFWYNKNKIFGIQLDMGFTTLDTDVSQRIFGGYQEGLYNSELAPKIILNNGFWSSKHFMVGGVFNLPIKLHGANVNGNLNFQNSLSFGVSNVRTPDFIDEISTNYQGTNLLRHHQKMKNLNAFCYELSGGFHYSKSVSYSGFTSFGLFLNYHNAMLKGKESEIEIKRTTLNNNNSSSVNYLIPIDFNFSYLSIQFRLVYSFNSH